MKKITKKFLLITFLLSVLSLLVNQKIYAIADNSSMEEEYSENYNKWLELSDEEKQNVIQPRKYNIPYKSYKLKNPLLKAKMLGSNVNSQYNLNDIIPNNLSIRNQQTTSSCWAFAALSSLETNLALNDYYNGKTSTIYDFSERHMEYSTSRNFLDSKINSMGYNRFVGSGGTWDFASSYLTNGSGAINESEMPFENNEKIININEIQNKAITSQVYDTIEFPDYNDTIFNQTEVNDIKTQIKHHIQNYGSVFATVKAGSFAGISSPVSNTTGALAIWKGFSDHAVSIVGWDDNYSVDNWNEFEDWERPSNPGAWIVRNSWGTENGKNGYIYVSYEDENISESLAGIVKSSNYVDYDNIYQYDNYYPNYKYFSFEDKILICNIFTKETNETEYLQQVSLHIPEACVCKVYVNTSGIGKSKEELKQVLLKTGESENISSVGYHTLEFAKPVEITSNQFAVAIEISSNNGSNHVSCVETTAFEESPYYSVVEVPTGKCFKLDNYGQKFNEDYSEYYDYDWSGWEDFGTEGKITTIKAFTTSNLNDGSLKNIEIINPPTKTSYFEGEDFDKSGMVIKANYNSKTNPSITLNSSNYNVSDGTNLQVNQNNIIITYEDKSITQAITVEKNVVTEIKVKIPPSKLDYNEGQNFDKTGLIIEATYKNGTQKEITDYIIKDGNNLKSSQTKIIITYDEKSLEQSITVTPNSLTTINISKTPTKTKYIVGQNFDKTGMVVIGRYQDETTQEIIDYIVENGTNLQKGQTSVTIKYDGKTTTQEVIVEEKTITQISIDKNPTKTSYIQGKENLDLTGGTLKIKYNDESTETIVMTSVQVNFEGFDNSKLGEETITITYQSKTTQFKIKIIEEEKAKNSNLDNVKFDIKEIQAYYYTDASNKGYTLINVEINGVTKNLENDELEYYYYLSTNAKEQNINNWVKISEKQEDNKKIKFTVDTRNIQNYNEVSSESVVYLYIQEVAKKGGNQSITISKSMKLETDNLIETYVDDIKKDNIQPNKESKNSSDETTATGKLPQTGTYISIIVISIIAMLLIIIILFKKYNNYKDIK